MFTKADFTTKKLSIIILSLVLCVACVLLAETKWHQANKDPFSEIVNDDIKHDAVKLIDIIENVHPIFIINDKNLIKYEQAKKEFLLNITDIDNNDKFAMECNKYLSSLQDMHTQVLDFYSHQNVIEGKWFWEDDELYVVTDASRNPRKVVSIGSVSVSDLVDNIDIMVPSENKVAILENRTMFCNSRVFLSEAGAIFLKNGRIEVLFDDMSSQIMGFTAANYRPTLSGPDFSFEIIDKGIALITARRCNMGSSLDQVVEQITDFYSDGNKKVIFDLRGNIGGTSAVWDPFLSMISDTWGYRGSLERISFMNENIHDYALEDLENGYRAVDELRIGSINPKLDVVVIVDQWTYSAARWLPTMIYDNRAGVVIGQQPLNSSSSYGNTLFFHLGKTQVRGRVSSKAYLRPENLEGDAEDKIVNIYLSPNDDWIARAIGILKGTSINRGLSRFP